MTTYNTKGTCSRAINYEVADGVVTKCEFVGGCPGNTQGVAKLVPDMKRYSSILKVGSSAGGARGSRRSQERGQRLAAFRRRG